MGAEISKDISQDKLETLRQNTTFNRKEIKDWYQKFHSECPSGEMNKEQFMLLYSKLFPHGDVRQYAEHIYKSYDVDGNGTVDFQEFLCTMNLASRGPLDDKLQWAFHLYDIDGNGYVTKDEALHIVKSIYRMKGLPFKATPSTLTPKQAVEVMFQKMDSNGDEKLSELEFVAGAKSDAALLALMEGTSSDSE